MRKMNYILWLTGTIGLTFVSNCGSNSSSTKPVTETIRTGRASSNVDPVYMDSKPSLSSDGTKVVFSSGRDNGTSRIYKSSFVGNAWETPSKLSSATGMTSENTAKISPDGSWVLIEGANVNGKTLGICNFSSGSCTSVSTSVWGQGNFGFSPDSSMFFILSGTKSSGASVYLADTSSPTTLVLLSGQDQWLEAFWATNNNPFTLVTTSKSTNAGKKTFYTRSLTTASSASSSNASALTTEASYGAIVDSDSASSNLFSIVSPIKPTKDKTFNELGSIEDAIKKTIPVRSELLLMSTSGTIDSTTLTQPGFETLKAFVTSDDASIFTLNRMTTRCSGDTDSIYGFSMAILNRSANTITWRHLKKPADLNQAPTFSSDPCDRTLGESTTTYDFGPTDVQVNHAATSTTNTVAWTSDMGGDPEIYIAVTTSGATSVFNISSNRKP